MSSAPATPQTHDRRLVSPAGHSGRQTNFARKDILHNSASEGVLSKRPITSGGPLPSRSHTAAQRKSPKQVRWLPLALNAPSSEHAFLRDNHKRGVVDTEACTDF